jgi:hypothetical protein
MRDKHVGAFCVGFKKGVASKQGKKSMVSA